MRYNYKIAVTEKMNNICDNEDVSLKNYADDNCGVACHLYN